MVLDLKGEERGKKKKKQKTHRGIDQPARHVAV